MDGGGFPGQFVTPRATSGAAVSRGVSSRKMSPAINRSRFPAPSGTGFVLFSLVFFPICQLRRRSRGGRGRDPPPSSFRSTEPSRPFSENPWPSSWPTNPGTTHGSHALPRNKVRKESSPARGRVPGPQGVPQGVLGPSGPAPSGSPRSALFLGVPGPAADAVCADWEREMARLWGSALSLPGVFLRGALRPFPDWSRICSRWGVCAPGTPRGEGPPGRGRGQVLG